MIERILAKKCQELSRKFPILTLTGPRQSGKTTLVQNLFKDYEYLSFEDIDIRMFAVEDPRGFLKEYSSQVIFDEVQRAPELFSYLQTHTDHQKISGQYILTGSQNFLLSANISQSLAGRTAILHLLPLGMEELDAHQSIDEYMIKGGYPRIHDKDIVPADFFPSYISTYLERDIRLIKNITNLGIFERFVKLCAGRVGQLINFSALADDVGVTHNTIKSWLQLLESSFIIFKLQPHFKNFNKRLVKMPKLYFWDSGLLCSLLGIETAKQLSTHYLRGNIFESTIISELARYRFNRGRPANLFFWRDRHGHEIDCLIEQSYDELLALEIKAGQTISSSYFKGLKYWQKISDIEEGVIIYGGDRKQTRASIRVLPWNQCLDSLKDAE